MYVYVCMYMYAYVYIHIHICTQSFYLISQSVCVLIYTYLIECENKFHFIDFIVFLRNQVHSYI